MSKDYKAVTIDIPEQAPVFCGKWGRKFGDILLRTVGWKVIGSIPNVPKAVFIAAPHTSNIDWFLGIAALFGMGIRFSYLIKHSAFIGPIGWILHKTGGVPLDRSKTGSIVKTIVSEFESRETLYYVIAPEGTRARVKKWKTGFLRIAYEANVPVVMTAFDYPSKTIRFHMLDNIEGNQDKDMERVYEFFKPFQGRHLDRT